jgi:hypothetical protein
MHTLIGCYFVGTAIAIVILYDRDDGFWPLMLAFLWPAFVTIGLIGGTLSIIGEKLGLTHSAWYSNTPPKDRDG